MASTQEQIYEGLDLDLSWSESDLPERVRTKHVHRLHPYLGKYVPQLVEELFRRHVPARGRVLDPFAGSGTTLVQALESGLDSVGVDIAAFNCLLMRVKTGAHNPFGLEHDLRDALARFERGEGDATGATPYVRRWFAPAARDHLLRFRSLAERVRARRRAARRARARRALGAAHDALRSRLPEGAAARAVLVSQAPPRMPAGRARRSLPAPLHARHADSPEGVRARPLAAGRRSCCTATRASSTLPGPFDAVVTSPPYPGLIDYHEQHRYAYELLGLDDLREREIGAAARGTSKAALAAYIDGIAAVLGACAAVLKPRGRVVIVVNDRRDLYPEILERAGLVLEQRYQRHVNRRTGRRSGEYFEDVLVAHR